MDQSGRGEAEVRLPGDGVTPGLVRVGETVRRPVRPFTATVQAYLTHLHARGFHDAPRPMGYDDSEGREVLSYVPGDVPREPLPDDATTVEVLVALARMIRREHDAAEGWEPPEDAVWGSTPGNRPAGLVPLFERAELVAHMDYCPGNVVFRDGLPVALIGFDLARPTTRVNAIANALYWWAPLLDPLDRAPALVNADVPERAAAFAMAYDMTAQQRSDLMPVAVAMVRNFHLQARAAAGADPVFARFWAEGVKDRMPRAEAWVEAAGPGITARLRVG